MIKNVMFETVTERLLLIRALVKNELVPDQLKDILPQIAVKNYIPPLGPSKGNGFLMKFEYIDGHPMVSIGISHYNEIAGNVCYAVGIPLNDTTTFISSREGLEHINSFICDTFDLNDGIVNIR